MLKSFICLIPFAASVFGQQSKPLTLADCIRLANAAPNAVILARQEARIAALGVTATRSAFLPHAGLTAGAIYNSPRADRQAFVSFNGSHEYITLAGVALELDTSGRLRAAYARAKVDRDTAEIGVRISERDLRRAVTASFYRVLTTRKLADSAQAMLTEALAFEVRVKALFGGGEAAQADVVKASAQVAAFDQLKRAADLDARLANQELASYWTADVDTALDLEDSLAQAVTEPSPADASGAFLRRPEFRIFDLQKTGFTLDARRERAALLPQITLGYQFGIDANRYSWRERGSAVVASLNVPVFDWFRARSLSQQFAARALQIDNTRKVSERVFSREYESAKARLDSIQRQVETAGTQTRLFEQNLALSRVRYEGGEGPALDVVLAQNQLQQARANYVNTLFLYANARADLEVAAGR
ncbi:MAG: TolC family protein [Acidobacteria bacterium]|nr:TolC family protein [Acidobacteriota bacterium]